MSHDWRACAVASFEGGARGGGGGGTNSLASAQLYMYILKGASG